MLEFLAQKIARAYAATIARYIEMAIAFVVIHGIAYIAQHYPPVAHLCDPQQVAAWCDLAVAAVLNDLSTRFVKNATEREIVSGVTDAIKENPVPAVKAVPAK
jgi:hypothetical protein